MEQRKAAIKEKFANEEYPIHIIGRHLSVTDAMKSYAVDKLKKIERFGVRVIEATIVMDIQKLVHTVDFILNVNNTKIKVSGRTDTMYASIDQALGKLESKLRRYHKRLSEHHAKGVKATSMNVNVLEGPPTPYLDDINDQIEEENLKQREEELKPRKVISHETLPMRTLSQEEAIMKLELSGDQFFIYKSEADQKVKVIYRREDGNYGVIEPE